MTDELSTATCTTVTPFYFAEVAMTPAVLEALGSEWYWKPGSTLKVHFMDGSAELKQQVAEIAEEWTNYANLKFRFYFEQPPLRYRYVQMPLGGGRVRVPVGLATDIAITFWDNGGGQSLIGAYSRQISRVGQPSMHLPKSGNKRVVLHEFGHALGLQHEHQHPAHGIQWNVPAVYQYYKEHYDWSKEKVDSNVLHKATVDQSNYTAFDDKSIMLYPIPAALTLDGYSTDWNQELSATDQAFIAQVYRR